MTHKLSSLLMPALVLFLIAGCGGNASAPTLTVSSPTIPRTLSDISSATGTPNPLATGTVSLSQPVLTHLDQTATAQATLHTPHSALTDFDLTATAQAAALATPRAPVTGTPPPTAVFTPASTVAIRVDGGTRYQTVSGFGASFAPFNGPRSKLDDPNAPDSATVTSEQARAMIDIWFKQLGLTRTRIFPNAFEPTNDNADPFTLNASAFDWSGVNQLTDFVARSRPVGLQTYWASFSMEGGHQQAWLRLPDSCSLDPSKTDEEVEWLLAAALHFRDVGEELPYVTVNNEPDLAACKDHVKIEIPDYVTIVKRLGARLRSARLATKIVVSDGWLPQNVLRYAQAVLADADARQYVGAIAYHAYADGYDDPARILENSAAGNPPHAAVEVRQAIRDLAARYNLPVWMTEICYCTPRAGFSEFELLRARLNHLHDELTIGNVAAFDAINLYNIRRPGVYDELVEVSYRPDGSMERYQLATYGYLFGHYTRFVLPGSVRIAADSNDPRVRAVGFTRPDGKIIVVVLNNTVGAVQANLTFAGVTRSPTALSVLTSREGALWQIPPDLVVTNNRASLLLAPHSVTTLWSDK